MTRAEARMIAEELAKVLSPTNEEFMTRDEIASYLKVSQSWIDRHRDSLPHVMLGGNIRFIKSKVIAALMR